MDASAPAWDHALRRGLNPLELRVKQRAGFPVLPGLFPLLGHVPAIAVDELGLLREGALRLGPLFFWNKGFGNWELVCTMREAFALFRNKQIDSGNMREGGLRLLFGDAVIAHDGAVHQRMRAAMIGPFQPKGLGEAKVGELVAELVERRVRSWVGRREVRVPAETRELALSVIFRSVGVEEHELGEWRRHYENLTLLVINMPFDLPGSPRRRGLRSRQWLDERIARILARERASGSDRGLLPALLRSRDDNGEALSDSELIDNVRVFFFAGHETAASTMAWVVAHLCERPDVWQKLRDEARAASDLPRSPKELRSFPYAEAVFRETLRLHPPVSRDVRRAVADFPLGGRTVPKGTKVAIPIGLLSRDPQQYPEPDSFRPERWLGRQEGPSAFEMVQFGGGTHFCLGYHLAWMEIVAFAVALGRALPAVGPRLQSGFPASRYYPILHPSNAMRVRFD